MPASPAAATLPWAFFASPVCALRPGARALALTPAEAAHLAADETLPDGTPPLWSAVRRRATTASNAMFAAQWATPWPSGLGLRARTWPVADTPAPFLLTPAALYIRHPFATSPPMPSAPALEVKPGPNDLYSDALLEALDYAVDSDPGRCAFAPGGVPLDGEPARAFLHEIAEGFGGVTGQGLPQTWTVTTHPQRRTAETTFSWVDGALHVDLGWVRDTPGTGQPPVGGTDRIAKWPCDPLRTQSLGGWRASHEQTGCP